jgi:hypothetical protein
MQTAPSGFSFWENFPRLVLAGSGIDQRYYIECRLPDNFHIYYPIISNAEILHKEIVKQIQHILNSLDLVSAVEIEFSNDGIYIEVFPGTNGCYCFFSSRDLYPDIHNIETYHQAYAISECLKIVLMEIYRFLANFDTCQVEQVAQQETKKHYRIAKDPKTVSYQLFEIFDCNSQLIAYVYAKDICDAEELAERNQLGDVEARFSTKSYSEIIFPSVREFRFRLEFDPNDCVEGETISVLAASKEDALALATEMAPTLFGDSEIIAIGDSNGKFVRPQILLTTARS